MENGHGFHTRLLFGNVTSQGFGDFYKPAEERLNQLLAELPKLEAQIDHIKVSNLSTEEIIAEAKTLYDRWPEPSVDRRCGIVESVVEKITVGNGEIDITLSYLPTSEEMVKSQQALPPPSAPIRPP